MRHLLLIPVLLVCAACTTTKDLQLECAQMHERFVDEISCLSQKLDNEPSLKNDSFVSEYILSGKVLARKVQSGSMKEDAARLAFARKYNVLLLEQQRINTLSAVELDALSPRYQRCDFDRDGNSARCYDY